MCGYLNKGEMVYQKVKLKLMCSNRTLGITLLVKYSKNTQNTV